MTKLRAARTLLTLSILVIFTVYFFANVDSFKPVFAVDPIYLLLIGIAIILGIVSNGIFTKVVMRSFDKHISFRESVLVSLIAAAGNFFAPAGSGFGFRAVYLKKKHKLPYSDYVSMLSGNYILVFLTVAILGIVAILMLGQPADSRDSVARTTLLIVFGVLLLSSIAMLFIRTPKRLREKTFKNRLFGRLVTVLIRISDGWHMIASDKRLLVKLTLLIILNTSISVVSLTLMITALHFTVSIPALLLLSALGSLAAFINITPANLGIKEAVYIASSGALGLTAPQILSIALIERAVTFAVLAVLWLAIGRSRTLLQASKDVEV